MELILDKCDTDLDNCDYGNNGLLQSIHSCVLAENRPLGGSNTDKAMIFI